MAGITSALWVGIHEVELALAKVAAQVDAASAAALAKIGADVVKRAMGNFEGSHAKGQRHVGGNKPNVVTGNLRRSIFMSKATKLGVADWRMTVSFGAKYGRAVELGRHPGSNKYPFFTPAVEASRPSWGGTMSEEWSKFVL